MVDRANNWSKGVVEIVDDFLEGDLCEMGDPFGFFLKCGSRVLLNQRFG